MWIGSPLRGAFRLFSYFTLTLVLLPPYLLAMVLRIRPIMRWMPVMYHRVVCTILQGLTSGSFHCVVSSWP